MLTLSKPAVPSDLNLDLAVALNQGRVIDSLTGVPIRGSRKRARFVANLPCRRILAPRVASEDEREETVRRLDDMDLQREEAVVYAEGEGMVLLVVGCRPEIGSLILSVFRRAADGVWTSDRVDVAFQAGRWHIERDEPFVVDTPADADAAQARIYDDAMAAAGTLMAHLADVRAELVHFCQTATEEECFLAALDLATAAEVFVDGDKATIRLTLPTA